MILWRRFMGWATGLTHYIKNPTSPPERQPQKPFWGDSAFCEQSSPQFQALTWRLLSSYLVAMGAVVGISTVAIYHSVSSSLYQRLDRELFTLADAAAHNLPNILKTGTVTPERIPRLLDNDGDLDIPWQDLQQEQQSVEWFDANRRLLGKAGKQFPTHPPGENFQTWQQDKIRTLTVPVYAPAGAKPSLLGYVRVSESFEDEQEELKRLLIGMEWGGLIAIILIGSSGWWLTQRSLYPIEQSFCQLKQFTADASHELRSPLTAIRTAVEVMQSHPERVHPADVKKLETIASATQQMGNLVDDLLLLARTDTTAHLPGTAISIPLDELLEDLVLSLQPQAITKGVALTLSELPEIQVRGDAVQLRRLFVNLIENALHYTPVGGTVKVSSMELDSSHESALIQVQDTGIGIAPDHLPYIFDRFWRADQARSRREGGTGLGLAIAKAIAQIHGGKITVTSQVGVGSCFQVELPVV